MDSGAAVGGRRSLEEDKRPAALALRLDAVEEVFGLPALEQLTLELVRAGVGELRESHLRAPPGSTHQACFFRTSSVWAWAATCA